MTLKWKKTAVVYNTVITHGKNPTDQLLTHFSSWTKLKRAVLWFLKLKNILCSLCTTRKQIQNVVKRYGVIFTCMSSRALHLEVAYTLDTDSCINALRRFMSRRGQVQHIRSDNGTNLVGAKRELQNAITAWNQNKINNAMLQKGVQWSFNPLTASHHGGVWERFICMVRQVLFSIRRWRTADTFLWSGVHFE